MPRYKSNERDQAKKNTRQALLQAAAEEFAREGYQGANINHISRKAGYAKGTIYNYFPSKRALMQALIQDTAALHYEMMSRDVLGESRADKRLEAFFKAGFEFVNRYLNRGLAIVNHLYGPDAGFKQELFHAYQPMFSMVRQEILTLGISQEIFRAVDPNETTNLIMLMYLGVASQVDPDGKPWVSADRVIDILLPALVMKE